MATAQTHLPLEGRIPAPLSAFDSQERDRVLLEHLPQVRHIARRIHFRLPAQVPLDDLIDAGVVGLIDAVKKFDPAKNVQLKFYAKFRIRGAILDSLREMDWSPRHLRRQARYIEKASREFQLLRGFAPGEPELATELGLSLIAFQQLLGELRGINLGSLQAESAKGSVDEYAIGYSPGAREKDPFELCLQQEIKFLVSQAIDNLDERQRRVVTLHDLQELTMKEAGVLLGISESRVSQIHSAALIRLRAGLKERLRGRLSAIRSSVLPA